MSTYWRKPGVLVTATQWNEIGDDPQVDVYHLVHKVNKWFCPDCRTPMIEHGWLSTDGTGSMVCPGSYIVEESEGQKIVCAEDEFLQNYLPVRSVPELL